MFEKFDPNSKPDAVSEKGVKLWIDRTLTRYAQSKGIKGVQVFRSLFPDGMQEYLIVLDGKPVYAHQEFETVACRIDVIGLVENGSD